MTPALDGTLHRSASFEAQRREASRERRPDLAVECVDLSSINVFAAEWRDLSTRCLEPNVFLEPAVALSAARHLGSGRRVKFLLVWDGASMGGRRMLVGLCPIQHPGCSMPAPFVRFWLHNQATLGAPLIDRARANEALDAILTWSKSATPNAVGLTLPLLSLDGPTVKLLNTLAIRKGLDLRFLDRHDRAVLRRANALDWHPEKSTSSKRWKTLRKTRRRLERKGDVTFRVFHKPSDISVALADFFELESKGWKGRRGTALACASRTTAFAQAMTATLSDEEKCRIVRLALCGEPIAMGIVLISRDQAYFWKICYDENYAEFSPGVLLTLELTRALLEDRKIVATDSCACANHPMIDHIWSERMSVGDAFIALDASRSRSFARAIAYETLWRYARARVKKIVNKWRHTRCLQKRSVIASLKSLFVNKSL